MGISHKKELLRMTGSWSCRMTEFGIAGCLLVGIEWSGLAGNPAKNPTGCKVFICFVKNCFKCKVDSYGQILERDNQI